MTVQISQETKSVLFSASALVLIVAAIFAYSLHHKNAISASTSLVATGVQPPANRAVNRVKRVLLWPQFQSALQALGDRLETAGKERLILTGTIKRASGRAVEVPMRLVVEIPEKFRLEEQLGNRVRVTTFDGEKQDGLKRSDENIQNEQDEDEIESLIFDGVEHLFSGQMAGLAKREIGAYLQPNHATSATYTGPYFNVYEVMDRITHKPVARAQRKLYYFNTRTALPEIVRYQIERGRGSLAVELRMTDWQSFGGQAIPKMFARFENGVEILKLNVNTATVQATANDGIFTIPGK